MTGGGLRLRGLHGFGLHGKIDGGIDADAVEHGEVLRRGVDVGVVGVLQFEVLEYRLKNEYNVDIKLEPLPYEHIRWIENPQEIDVNRIVGTSDMKKIKDLKGNPLLVFANSWSVNMVLERNEGLKLSEFGKN